MGEVSMFLLQKRVEGLRPTTLETYEDILQGWIDKGLEYLDSLSLGKKKVALVVINQFLKWSGKELLSLKVKNPPLPHREHLTSEQVLQLASLPPHNNGKTGTKAKAFVLFLLDTGLRVSEACAVKKSEVDLQRGIVFVENGKGGKARTVFLSPITKLAISTYLKKRGHDDSEYLWSEGNQPYNRVSAYKLVQRELERIGIKDAHPHMLRHTFAVQWIQGGGDLRTLQLILGHSNINTTARYLQFCSEEQQTAHQQFSPLAKGIA